MWHILEVHFVGLLGYDDFCKVSIVIAESTISCQQCLLFISQRISKNGQTIN